MYSHAGAAWEILAQECVGVDLGLFPCFDHRPPTLYMESEFMNAQDWCCNNNVTLKYW
jgi:hypothetical protein